MNKRDKQVIAEFKRRVPADIAPWVKKIIIFGSRARGDATSDSDLDLAILVEVNRTDLESRMENIVYDIMWDFDFEPVISLKIFQERKFTELAAKGFSFYRHVQDEGITV